MVIVSQTGEALLQIARHTPPQIVVFLKVKYLSIVQLDSQAVIKLPDGSSYTARISQPTIMAKRVPSQLSVPMAARPILLKVALLFTAVPENKLCVESMPVEVTF